MPIRIDAYMSSGMAAGWLRGTSHPRTALESGSALEIDRATWQALPNLETSSVELLTLDPDEIIAVVDDDDTSLPVHSAWHAVVLDAGPYRMRGELPTLPGFDPGRALTRPSGEFVLLRNVRLTLIARPEMGAAEADHALVNRYVVERVEADLMLGFFFPGAEVDTSKLPAPSPAPG
jgi:hypothetical protein